MAMRYVIFSSKKFQSGDKIEEYVKGGEGRRERKGAYRYMGRELLRERKNLEI
jgi:hypothetical protein